MNWTEEEYQDFLKRKGVNIDSKPKNIKKNKYRNIKTTVDGITFDSIREAEYYENLKLLKAAGEIKDFGLQPKYELIPKFTKNGVTHRSIAYIADFIITNNDGTTDIVDIKGVETQVFKIKRKLFEYMYQDLNLKVIK